MKKRIRIIYSLIMLAFALLLFRLYYISSENPAKSVLSGQYSRRLDIAEKTVLVYDRNSKPLSFNKNWFATVVNTKALDASPQKTAETLSEISAFDIGELKTKIEKDSVFSILTNSICDYSWAKSIPYYQMDDSTFLRHIIGYEAQGNRVGLLKYYEDFFNAQGGSLYSVYEADAENKLTDERTLTVIDDNYENDSGIILTIDKEIQRICEKAAEGYLGAGAILVCDSQSGDILSCVSRPVYDVNELSKSLLSEDGEFLNRAFEAYPLGSVFKLAVAAAALENNPESIDFMHYCDGKTEIGGRSFKCHKKEGHGLVDMKIAFAESCNTYFIELAKTVGFDMIIEMAERMGIREKVLVDRFNVKSGNLPKTDYPSDALLANTALGQGEILVTPLEAVNILNASATGYITDFTLVKGFMQNGNTVFNKAKEKRRVLDESVVVILRELLRACVNEGTGQRAYMPDADVGGKTATAETGKYDENGLEISQSWFVGAFPIEKPKYTVCILYDRLTKQKNNGTPQDIFAQICKKLMDTK